MIEIGLLVAAGVIAGVIAGVTPGIGIFAAMVLLYPWLASLPGPELIIFYVALASTTQYIGSIPSTFFGIPGEATSIPAVAEGHELHRRGQGALAISGAAVSSLIGSMIILIMIILVFPYLANIATLYSSYLQLATLVLVIGTVISSSNGWVRAAGMSLLGYLLGKIGCDHDNRACFATFGNDNLSTGLPFISVMTALYVFPTLIKHFQHRPVSDVEIVGFRLGDIFSHIRYYVQHIGSSIRGTIVGFFAGFIPGASMIIASNLSYAIEKIVQKRQGTYQPGNYGCLISAEAANNASIFSVLIPLMLFGIPLIASEALLYDMAVSNGYQFGGLFLDTNFLETLAIVMIIVNAVAFMIAWPMARYVSLINRIDFRIIYVIVFAVLVGTVWMLGAETFQSAYYLLVLAALLPLGYAFKNTDTIPLIFCFLIAERIDSIVPRVIQLLS